MGKTVLRDVYVTVDGADVSSYCREVSLDLEADAAETTTWIDAYRTWVDGPQTARLRVAFFSDAATELLFETAFADPPAVVQLQPAVTIPGGTYGSGTYGLCPYGADAPIFAISCVPLRHSWGGALGSPGMSEWELVGMSEVVEGGTFGSGTFGSGTFGG